MEHPSPPAQPPIQGPALPEEKPAYRITIEEVVEALLDDGQGRQLRKGATGRSKTLLQTQLIPWAHQRTLRYLDELTASVLTRFRAHWSKDLANSQNTARRKHERLCGFDEVAAIPDAAVKALTTPVSLTGTAEEIDAGGSRERLSGARSSPSPSPSLQVMVRFVFMEVGGLTCIKRSILVNTKAAKDE